MLYHDKATVNIAQVVRYTISYHPEQDSYYNSHSYRSSLPSQLYSGSTYTSSTTHGNHPQPHPSGYPTSEPRKLYLRIRNTASILLRAAYLQGPYILSVSVQEKGFNANSEDGLTARWSPVYEPELKASTTFWAELALAPENEQNTWVVEISSQAIFSHVNTSFELTLGHTQALARKATSHTITGHSSLTILKQSTSDLWPPSSTFINPAIHKNVHLVVLTHGLHSNLTADMLYLKERLESETSIVAGVPSSGAIVVRGYDGNVCRTGRGIKYLATRLTSWLLSEAGYSMETASFSNVAPPYTKISFVGHSLGGLVQTCAIAMITVRTRGEFFKKLKPENFVTLASPWLGVSAENPAYVKFALDMGVIGRTGQDLGLMPRLGQRVETTLPTPSHPKPGAIRDSRPILRLLALPTSPAHQIIKQFRRRTIYANVVNDGIVPLRTGALFFLDWRSFETVHKRVTENLLGIPGLPPLSQLPGLGALGNMGSLWSGLGSPVKRWAEKPLPDDIEDEEGGTRTPSSQHSKSLLFSLFNTNSHDDDYPSNSNSSLSSLLSLSLAGSNRRRSPSEGLPNSSNRTDDRDRPSPNLNPNINARRKFLTGGVRNSLPHETFGNIRVDGEEKRSIPNPQDRDIETILHEGSQRAEIDKTEDNERRRNPMTISEKDPTDKGRFATIISASEESELQPSQTTDKLSKFVAEGTVSRHEEGFVPENDHVGQTLHPTSSGQATGPPHNRTTDMDYTPVSATDETPNPLISIFQHLRPSAGKQTRSSIFEKQGLKIGKAYRRGQTIDVNQDGKGIFDKPPPPRTSVFESFGGILNPPLPDKEFLCNPSTRPQIIFHDRIYTPADIPPILCPNSTSSQGNPIDNSTASASKREKLKLEEKIARDWHVDMDWRKVLVKLEPDAHNNIIVRRFFANAFGWGVVEHLVKEHFRTVETDVDREAKEVTNEETPKMEPTQQFSPRSYDTEIWDSGCLELSDEEHQEGDSDQTENGQSLEEKADIVDLLIEENNSTEVYELEDMPVKT